MFNFFRRKYRGKNYKLLLICDNLYFVQGSDIVVVAGASVDAQVCGFDHVAPNGVGIKQIAYALALIDGAIAITDSPISTSVVSSRIGLN